MNFKFTYTKTVCTVIVVIIVWLVVYVPNIPGNPMYLRDPIFNVASLIILLSAIIFYTIWSLLENKRGKR